MDTDQKTVTSLSDQCSYKATAPRQERICGSSHAGKITSVMRKLALDACAASLALWEVMVGKLEAELNPEVQVSARQAIKPQ